MAKQLDGEEIQFDKLLWTWHSHISMSSYYLTTEVADVSGKKYYRHTRTQRTIGANGLGSSKVTYSESLESEDLTEDSVRKLIALTWQKINEMHGGTDYMTPSGAIEKTT